MPTIRLREGSVTRSHANKYGPGITPRYLASGEVGELAFDDTLFTYEQAEGWLRAHDFEALSHSTGAGREQATPEQQDDSKVKQRFLSINLSPASADMQSLQNGGLLVKNVPLLAEGVWTDSYQGTPCEYSPAVLRAHSGNWTGNTLWSRHRGNSPRDITDKLGTVVNPHFGEFAAEDGSTRSAVMGDLKLDADTQKQKDVIGMVKSGSAGAVSVEMGTIDKWNPGKKRYEAQSIEFTGTAMVDRGACSVCKVPGTRNNEAGDPANAGDEVRKAELEKFNEAIRELDKAFESAGCQIPLSAVYPGKKWSDLTDAQIKHFQSFFAYTSGDGLDGCHLPIKDPKTGAIKLNCVRNALARLNQVQGLGIKADAIKAKLQALLPSNKNQERLMEAADLANKTPEQITKDLEDGAKAQKKLAKKQKKLAKKEAELAETKTALETKSKELETLAATVKEMGARLEKIEKLPADPATAGAGAAKELELPTELRSIRVEGSGKTREVFADRVQV